MIHHRLGIVVTLGLLGFAPNVAAADPVTPPPVTAPVVPPAMDPLPGFTVPTHIHSSSSVTTDGGSTLRLPPGYFMDEPSWDNLNVQVKKLQDLDTNLTAQNQAMQSSLSGWSPGWRTLAVAVVTGVALGVYLDRKL